MFGRRYAGALVLGALLSVVGCSNMQQVQERDPEESQMQQFNAEFRKVVDTGAASIRQMNLVVTEITENDEAATILFIRPGSFTNYGGVGRMIVRKSDTPPITVQLQYDRRYVFTYGAGERTMARNIFTRMEREIAFSGPKS